MELVIMITKPVADQSEAEILAAQVRTFVSNSPTWSDPLVCLDIETRDKIDEG